ncbi:hypothetical protein BGY98DRAFT_603652 [Russula aff. rugulosa BPL654]|nr:hypothetical protein BGY98DRAFT_603652 [Russula aff. rugulosa BPL654]
MTLSERSASRIALRGTRVFSLLLTVSNSPPSSRRRPKLSSYYSSNSLVARLTPVSLDLPGWMRVLVMEIMHKLCGDVDSMCSVWQRYGALATGGDTSSASSAGFPRPPHFRPQETGHLTSRLLGVSA